MSKYRDQLVAKPNERVWLSQISKGLFGLRSSVFLQVITLLILPVFLIWINNTIIFVNPIGVGSFVYSGFHLHLPEFLSSRLGGTYNATRIPWIAMGYVAHRLFDTEYALYVEHILVFYLAVFSLYSAVSTIFNDRLAAFAATMLMATYSWFLLAIGWDYVDGPYTACLLLSLAMIAAAAFGRRWRLAAIGWGVALALTVSLYVLWITLVPIEIGMFLCFNRLGRSRNIYSVAAYASGGAVAALICMGFISWLAGGEFLYLLPQIMVAPAVAANRFRWDVPLSEWLWEAEYLLVPGAIWLFSAVWAVRNARPAIRKLQSGATEIEVTSNLWIACASCVAAFFVFVSLQVTDLHLLDVHERINALLPFAFVVLGAVFAVTWRAPSERPILACTFVIVVLALAPWIASGLNLIVPQPSYFTGPVAVICWIGVGALILFLPLASGQLKYVLAVLFFSVIGFGTADIVRGQINQASQEWHWGDYHWLSFPPDPFYKQATLAIFEASRDVAPFNPDMDARFWFDIKDPLSEQLRNVVSTYMYEYSLLNENFPSLTGANGKVSMIAPGDRIIVLTSGDDPLPAANRAIADKHLAFSVVASKQIRREGIAFRFVVMDAFRPAGASGCGSSSSSIDKIPLGALEPQDGTVSAAAGVSSITTSAQQWAYAATAPLPIADHSDGPGVVCVRLQVDEGKLGIGVFARGDPSEMLIEEPVKVTNIPTDIELELVDIARAGSIVLRSWSPNGVGVKARIYSLELRKGEAK